MNTKIENTKKKTHGIFYTPDEVASLLCDWAIQSPSDTVLEPSFGGCGFLKAIHRRFSSLGISESDIFQRIYGSDIDPVAFQYLREILPYSNGHFLQADFLALNIDSFPSQSKVSVIVGNPPYVSHHNMLPKQKEKAWEWLQKSGFRKQIGKRSSLWVYFVLHSLSFLQPGGRIVWVLPGSFLHADYARSVRKILEQHFTRLLAIAVGSRLFIEDGTEEMSIFLLGDGYQPSRREKGRVSFSFAASPTDASKIIQDWDRGKLDVKTFSPANYLPKMVLDVYQHLSSQANVVTLGDLYNIRIGIVSGANDFFILTKKKWDENRLPDSVLTYILPRFRFAEGALLSKSDLLDMQEAGKPCMMLDTSKVNDIPLSVKDYLSTFPEQRLHSTTFRRRASRIWHHFNDHRIPDAFFPYMNKDGPHIVINEAGVISTNSIHRLYLKSDFNRIYAPDSNTLQKQIAISILTTFSQLSAELVGRVYGAGVLKHEPSEAKQIRLALDITMDKEHIATVFREVDIALRSNNRQRAQEIADDFVFSNFSLSERKDYRESLLQGLMTMRLNRSPRKWKR